MLTVTIKECSGNFQVFTSRHKTLDKWEAIERAVRKHWGTSAALHIDNGLSTENFTYGQIGRPCGQNVINMLTGRVVIEIS